VLDTIDAERCRREQLLRRNRLVVRVRVIDDAPLHRVGKADVAREEIDAERRRAIELLIELCDRRDRHAAGIVRANAVEWIAGNEEARSRPASRLERLAALEHA